MAKPKHKVKNKPKDKGLYAWNYLHAGSFLLFLKEETHHYEFMFLPGPSRYCLTREDFEHCVSANVLEFVETLPDEIYQESLHFLLQCPPTTSYNSGNEIYQKNKN
jgi:hypothetical protein